MKSFKQHSLYEAKSSDFSAWEKMRSFPNSDKTKEWLDWIIKGDVDDKGKSLPPDKKVVILNWLKEKPEVINQMIVISLNL